MIRFIVKKSDTRHMEYYLLSSNENSIWILFDLNTGKAVSIKVYNHDISVKEINDTYVHTNHYIHNEHFNNLKTYLGSNSISR